MIQSTTREKSTCIFTLHTQKNYYNKKGASFATELTRVTVFSLFGKGVHVWCFPFFLKKKEEITHLPSPLVFLPLHSIFYETKQRIAFVVAVVVVVVVVVRVVYLKHDFVDPR
jgi:hypothetical protein